MKLINVTAMCALANLLIGCAQLSQGQLQPVKRVSIKEEIYSTSCSGTVETWGSCYSKAKSTCQKGYEVIDKVDRTGSAGADREITFQCK